MPISEPTLRQWDVVVLPFPYADRLAEKRRVRRVHDGVHIQFRDIATQNVDLALRILIHERSFEE